MSFRRPRFEPTVIQSRLTVTLMVITRSIMISLVFAAAAAPAFADNDTFTQVGIVSCPHTGNYVVCKSVTFPKPFGGAPTVILSITGCTVNDGPGSINDAIATKVTAAGFQPTLLDQRYVAGYKGCNLSWVAVGPTVLNATAVANYIVLTVIYAPPGTNGGHSTSSVSYQTGSSTGTTTSASQSFKVANSVSFEASGGFLGNGGGTGTTFEYSRSTTDSQSLEIKKSTAATINQAGADLDGINHDEDEIWLLLNPTVNLGLSSSSATWIFGNTPSTIQYVHVKWLNGHEPMPTGVATALQSAGITPRDYADIMARDPLANGSSTLDPTRFVFVNTTYPYEPPTSANSPVPTVSITISDSSTSTLGSAVEDDYKVGLTMSAEGNYLDFAKATLKDTTSWEWTNKSSQSSSTGTSQSASLTIGGPSYGYAGPTLMKVYIDTMYKTFVFVIVPAAEQEISVDGTLIDKSGTPLPNKEVVLAENGTKHRTFTNAKGEYKFFGHISGPAKIETVGITQVVPQLESTTRHVQLRIP
jgi:hypothetical protein